MSRCQGHGTATTGMHTPTGSAIACPQALSSALHTASVRHPSLPPHYHPSPWDTGPHISHAYAYVYPHNDQIDSEEDEDTQMMTDGTDVDEEVDEESRDGTTVERDERGMIRTQDPTIAFMDPLQAAFVRRNEYHDAGSITPTLGSATPPVSSWHDAAGVDRSPSMVGGEPGMLFGEAMMGTYKREGGVRPRETMGAGGLDGRRSSSTHAMPNTSIENSNSNSSSTTAPPTTTTSTTTTPDPATLHARKRATQNRLAQRSFRQRKEAYTASLESQLASALSRIALLESQLLQQQYQDAELNQRVREAEAEVWAVKWENAALRREVERIGAAARTAGGSGTVLPGVREMLVPGGGDEGVWG